MATQSERGVLYSTLCPKYLHSNSTSHTWPFSAIAELIDNAYDPDVRAKQFWIDKTVVKGQECLSFMDNGNGLDHKHMHKMLSFGYSDKTAVGGVQPIGIYGNGFKSGSMRLGKDAIVFSKSESTSCVGMLSQTYLTEINAEQISVPIICFGLTEASPFSVQEEYKASLRDILQYSPYTTIEEILTELSAISPPWSTGKTGTRIIIWNLNRTSAGKLEFDFVKDRYDIRLPNDVYEEMNNATKKVSYIPECTYSLRAYCSILYLKPRMQIVICGQKVKSELIAKSLASSKKDTYKPTSLKRSIPITFGYNPKNKDQYGVMMYHKNRLIKAYERVGCQNRANNQGVGVIGIIECNFLEPTHNKQSFNETDIYRRTMNTLGVKLEEYCKEVRFRWTKDNPNSSTTVEAAMKRPDQNWVQCDDCLRWRRLPDGIDCSKLPDKWFCHTNPDPQFRSCLVEEEPEDSDDEQTSYRKTYKQQEKEEKKQQEQKRQKDEEERLRREVKRLANLDRQKKALHLSQTAQSTSAPTRSSINTDALREDAVRAESSPYFFIPPEDSTPSTSNGLPVISNVRSLSAPPLRTKRTPPVTPQRPPKRSKVSGLCRSIFDRSVDVSPSLPVVEDDDDDDDVEDGNDDIVILEAASTPRPKSPSIDMTKVKEEEPSVDDASMVSECSDDAAVDGASETNPAGANSTGCAAAFPPELNSTTQTEVAKIKREVEDHNQTTGKRSANGNNVAGDAYGDKSSPLPLSNGTEAQDQLIEIMQTTAQDRDSRKEEGDELTCQMQEMQNRTMESPQTDIKKASCHQASQTVKTEETVEGNDYKTMFENAKQKVDKLIMDKVALLAATEGQTSTGQSEENVTEEIAQQVDRLMRELDQSVKEGERLRTLLDSVLEERETHAAQCAAEERRKLIALRQNIARLLVPFKPALDPDQVDYEGDAIDEILEQVLSEQR